MKKCMFLMLAIALMVGAGCKKEDNNPDPTPVKKLKAMGVKKWTVKAFPSTNNGASWDFLGDRPDIFIQVNQEGVFKYATDYYTDAINTQVYSWNDYVLFDDVDDVYTISLYDHDDITAHQVMSSISFKVKDQQTTASQFNFVFGGVDLTIDVVFFFE